MDEKSKEALKLKQIDNRIEKLRHTLKELDPIYEKIHLVRARLIRECNYFINERESITQGQFIFDETIPF